MECGFAFHQVAKSHRQSPLVLGFVWRAAVGQPGVQVALVAFGQRWSQVFLLYLIDISCAHGLVLLMTTFTSILSDLQAAIAVRSARDRRLTVLLVAMWARLERRLGYDAVAFGLQLRHLLSQEDCAEFLAAMPQAGRILRPLLRLLSTDPLPDVI